MFYSLLLYLWNTHKDYKDNRISKNVTWLKCVIANWMFIVVRYITDILGMLIEWQIYYWYTHILLQIFTNWCFIHLCFMSNILPKHLKYYVHKMKRTYFTSKYKLLIKCWLSLDILQIHLKFWLLLDTIDTLMFYFKYLLIDVYDAHFEC